MLVCRTEGGMLGDGQGSHVSVCSRVFGGRTEGIWTGTDERLGNKEAGRVAGSPVLLGSPASQAGVGLHGCVHACVPIFRV